MFVFYDKDTAISTLHKELGNLEDSYYMTFRLVGEDVYKAVVKEFGFLPFLDYRMESSNDFNSYYARMNKLEERNKSRAKFVNVYRYQVYLNRDKNYAVDLAYSGIDRILSVDGVYLNICMNSRHPVIESLYLFDDNRSYRKQLPGNYNEQHPNPTKKITVLTDNVLNQWMSMLLLKAKDYDDIVHHTYERNYEFIQRIEDNIDPTKCDSYTVTENKGEIVANGLVLSYNIDENGYITWGLDIHKAYNSNFDNVVSRFIAMTDTKK